MCTLQVELLDADGLELPCESSTMDTELHLNSCRFAANPPTARMASWPLLCAHGKRGFLESTIPGVTPSLLYRCRHAVDPVPGPLRPAGWHSS